MPRIARKFYKGQFYHIMVQGIEKKFIFNKEIYKEKYIQLMKYYFNQSNILIVAYCVMDNHVHILVHICEMEQLSKTMQKINSVYAMYYNKEEKRVGYVYRERFKSQEIENQKHLYNCIIYIHENPVKAKIIQEAERYLYSSCDDYIKRRGIFNSKLRKVLEENGLFYKMSFTNKSNSIDYNDFIEAEEDTNYLLDALTRNKFELVEMLQSKEKTNKIVFYMKDNMHVSLRNIADKLDLSREFVRRIYNIKTKNKSCVKKLRPF